MGKPKYFYRIVHDWLGRHYGKASKCENPNCSGECKRFEYALRHGFEHGRDISRYISLCSRCHRLYDMTPEKAILFSRHIAGKYNDNLKLGPISNIGKPKSEATREKIRQSKLGKKLDPLTHKYNASN